MNTITYKQALAPGLWRMDVNASRIAQKCRAGQFVIVRVSAEGERIPLTIADHDDTHITLIFQEVGLSTKHMAMLNVNDTLHDLVGPLGMPSHIEGIKRILCIGGGVGIAVLYPLIKALKAQGSVVDVILGARNESLLILRQEIEAMADNVYITTDDGSAGVKGLVTDEVKRLLSEGQQYDEAMAVGPLVMMKFVTLTTKPFGLRTMVSMNPLMVDGTGMCGCCRVAVGSETKYACVDGPDFDGHLVDFDLSMERLRIFKEEEAIALAAWDAAHGMDACACTASEGGAAHG